jgi:hypothetical protein
MPNMRICEDPALWLNARIFLCGRMKTARSARQNPDMAKIFDTHPPEPSRSAGFETSKNSQKQAFRRYRLHDAGMRAPRHTDSQH